MDKQLQAAFDVATVRWSRAKRLLDHRERVARQREENGQPPNCALVDRARQMFEQACDDRALARERLTDGYFRRDRN